MAALPTFEQKVSQEARRFDLKPLVDLLLENGYGREEIMFESAQDRSSGGVVDSGRFVEAPGRTVRGTVNLGLLGDNTLLPSYFFEAIEKSADPERFYDFVRFFDHRLIESFFRASYPETDPATIRDWNEMQRSFTRMLGVSSTSTLAWLAKLHFPELRVHAERRGFTRTAASPACRTGESRLDGTRIIGRIYESDSAGFVVDLFADEEADARGRAWPHVVRTRLENKLLPLLAPHRVPLVVRLRVLFHASWVKVDPRRSSLRERPRIPWLRAHSRRRRGGAHPRGLSWHHRRCRDDPSSHRRDVMFLYKNFIDGKDISEVDDIVRNLGHVLRTKRGAGYFLSNFGLSDAGYRTPEEMITRQDWGRKAPRQGRRRPPRARHC